MPSEHYHCLHCDWFGDEPAERESFERFEAEGHRFTQRFVTVICPNCGDEALDEKFPCAECSERPVEIEDWCRGCYERLEAAGELIPLLPEDRDGQPGADAA